MNNITFPSKYLEDAVSEISKLPGIGKKTALRLALYILKQEASYSQNLGNTILKLKEGVLFCKSCHAISDTEECEICSNPLRDNTIICIVENIKDVMIIESTQQFRGLYHVLGGIISPIDGISPHDIEIPSLIQRVENNKIQEIIFALPATIEGDTTSFYIYKKLQHTNIIISMLARGVSVGTELEYTDEATIARSLKNRTAYTGKA